MMHYEALPWFPYVRQQDSLKHLTYCPISPNFPDGIEAKPCVIGMHYWLFALAHWKARGAAGLSALIQKQSRGERKAEIHVYIHMSIYTHA